MKHTTQGASVTSDEERLLPKPASLPHADDPVARVLASETFRRSARLKSLLSYLWEHVSTGHLEEVTEQQIGTALFGRPADYDSANDNIVRVTVRQLRLKLKEYYETEGASETHVILIRKGNYIPELVPRQQAENLPVSVELSAVSESAKEPNPAHLAERVKPAAEPMLGRVWFWRRVSLGLAVLATLLAVFAVTMSHSVRRVPVRERDLTSTDNLIKATVLIPRQKTTVVVGDSNLEFVQTILHRPVTLNEYLNREISSEGSGAASQAVHEICKRLIANHETSMAELAAASRILQANPDQAEFLLVGGPAAIGAQDLHSSNVVLLGNPSSNPWMNLISSSFNFQIVYDATIGSFVVRNQNPKPGEPPQYKGQSVGETDISYAFIGVAPNSNGNGSVLVISGTRAEAVTSAGEFVCHREAVPRLCEVLRVENLQETLGFEVLLKVESLGGISRSSQVVGSRTTLRTRL